MTLIEKRLTSSQRKRFWAICMDFQRSGIEWAGKRRSKEEWRLLLMSGHKVATSEDTEIVQGLESELIDLRESLTTMSTSRGASLIEYATAMAHHLGVPLHDPALEAAFPL